MQIGEYRKNVSRNKINCMNWT